MFFYKYLIYIIVIVVAVVPDEFIISLFHIFCHVTIKQRFLDLGHLGLYEFIIINYILSKLYRMVDLSAEQVARSGRLGWKATDVT